MNKMKIGIVCLFLFAPSTGLIAQETPVPNVSLFATNTTKALAKNITIEVTLENREGKPVTLGVEYGAFSSDLKTVLDWNTQRTEVPAGTNKKLTLTLSAKKGSSWLIRIRDEGRSERTLITVQGSDQAAKTLAENLKDLMALVTPWRKQKAKEASWAARAKGEKESRKVRIVQ